MSCYAIIKATIKIELPLGWNQYDSIETMEKKLKHDIGSSLSRALKARGGMKIVTVNGERAIEYVRINFELDNRYESEKIEQ